MRNQNHQRTYQKIQNEDNGGLKNGKEDGKESLTANMKV